MVHPFDAKRVYVCLCVDGTSASAPIFAGIITLLNDYRLNHKKRPMGFINQFLYQAAAYAPASFYDVVIGTNNCGAIGTAPIPTCCPYGFSASVGYDVVTGLGTPNFLALLNYLQQLP